jgi:hypothetical protein
MSSSGQQPIFPGIRVVAGVSRATERVSRWFSVQGLRDVDPFLAGSMASAWIRGVQSERVMTCRS